MTQRFLRYDKGIELNSPTTTLQGYLKADARITRCGIFSYIQPDGTVQREFRSPEEVFNEDSLATLKEIPVTNGHPQNPLNVENTGILQVGYSGSNIKKIDDHVAATLTITNKPTIKDVETGKKTQISGGYTCDIDATPGLWQGQRYDVAQKNIRYNHIAIVRQGRAGPQAAIKMDSVDVDFAYEREDEADEIVDKKNKKEVVPEKKDSQDLEITVNYKDPKEKNKINPSDGGPIMAKIKIGSVNYDDIPEGVAALVSNLETKFDAVLDRLDAMAGGKKGKGKSKSNTSPKGEAPDADDDDDEEEDDDDEDMEDKKDRKKDKKKDKKMDSRRDSLSRADAIAMAKDYVKAEEFALKVIGKDYKCDSEDPIDIKRDVVAKLQKNTEDRSDAYIEAAFDILRENYKNPGAEKLKQNVGKSGIRMDSNTDNRRQRGVGHVEGVSRYDGCGRYDSAETGIAAKDVNRFDACHEVADAARDDAIVHFENRWKFPIGDGDQKAAIKALKEMLN